MKKLLAFVPALGGAALPFLTQVTASGGSVALESSEISSITDAVINGATSMLNMNVQLLGVAVMVTVIGVVIGILGGFSHIRNRLGKRKR